VKSNPTEQQVDETGQKIDLANAQRTWWGEEKTLENLL